uniref:Uncharacterized protein n=1 Tax=Chenopodium quinoa TaxID=63459 RepID=A0A803MCR9_CHEQI
MVSQDYIQKMEVRQNFRNLWHADLLRTVQADTPYMYVVQVICLAVVGVVKANALNFVLQLSYLQAQHIICGREPPFVIHTLYSVLLLGETVALWFLTISAAFDLQGFMVCLNQIACIFSIVAMIVGSQEIQEASQLLNCLSDLVYCTVCACMQTQHKIEMDKRDGKFGPQPMAVPPVQQMSRIDQPYPPTVGYPSQPQGYPPQPQGYPPQGYPPQAHGYPPQPQGYPAPGYPPAGSAYPPQGYPPAGYPK